MARRWALMANKDEVVHLGSNSETLESGLDRSKSGSRLVVDPITASRPSPKCLSTRPSRHSTAAPHAEGRAHDGPYVGDVFLGASTPILPSRLSRPNQNSRQVPDVLGPQSAYSPESLMDPVSLSRSTSYRAQVTFRSPSAQPSAIGVIGKRSRLEVSYDEPT